MTKQVRDHIIDEKLRIALFDTIVNNKDFKQIKQFISSSEPELDTLLSDIEMQRVNATLGNIYPEFVTNLQAPPVQTKYHQLKTLIQNVYWSGVIAMYVALAKHWEVQTGIALHKQDSAKAVMNSFMSGHLDDEVYERARQQLEDSDNVLPPETAARMKEAVQNHEKVKADLTDCEILASLGVQVSSPVDDMIDKTSHEVVESEEDVPFEL